MHTRHPKLDTVMENVEGFSLANLQNMSFDLISRLKFSHVSGTTAHLDLLIREAYTSTMLLKCHCYLQNSHIIKLTKLSPN